MPLGQVGQLQRIHTHQSLDLRECALASERRHMQATRCRVYTDSSVHTGYLHTMCCCLALYAFISSWTMGSLAERRAQSVGSDVCISSR